MKWYRAPNYHAAGIVVRQIQRGYVRGDCRIQQGYGYTAIYEPRGWSKCYRLAYVVQVMR